jgi:hypothetical protein
MGMPSGFDDFDDEVRRAVNRKKDNARRRDAKEAEDERERVTQKQTEEREREELKVFRDEAVKKFQSRIDRTIEYLVAHGVQPATRITILPGSRNSARIEAPEPSARVGIFGRKTVRPPEPPPAELELRGWPMGISSMGNTTIRPGYQQDGVKYHPDQTIVEPGRWIDGGREEYFLSRDGNIHLLTSGSRDGRWYLQETVGVPEPLPRIEPLLSGEPPIIGTKVISEWQQKWRKNLAEFVAELTT